VLWPTESDLELIRERQRELREMADRARLAAAARRRETRPRRGILLVARRVMNAVAGL